MESEVNLLRRRYLDSVQSNKSMKQLMKVQKDKSRQLIVACAYKLQEKEAEIKNVSQVEHIFCNLDSWRPRLSSAKLIILWWLGGSLL